jgi:hypothetical protein
MKIILAVLVLAVLAVAFLVQIKAAKRTDRTGSYRRRPLMTDNEEEFFGRLAAALPDHYVFPQVGMSALLDTASSDKRKAHGDRLRVAQQRVDYVVCTKRCEVVAVVELDDKTHSRAKDDLRDSRLEQAGIRTVRFQSRNKPKADAIRAMVLGSIAAEGSITPSETIKLSTPPVAAGPKSDRSTMQ